MTGSDASPSIMSREPFRCVLVGLPSDRETGQAPALGLAVELALAEKSTLSLYVFAPRLHTPLPTSAATASTWLTKENEHLANLAAATARAATKIVAKEGLDVITEHPRSPFEEQSARFVQLARVHDLTILDAADISDTARRTVIEDVLFDSGRALLLVPQHGGTARPRRIAIGWDGSAQASRAVKDALPLLATAQEVIAVTVEGEKDLSRMAPGADLATYLVRHRIECKLATLNTRTRDVAERLRLFVAEEHIGMIVMGAFVHSRFRQAVLGGVTQALLDQPPVPMFMAH